MSTVELPIESVLPSLRQALVECRSAVLVAPPGAGKTTRVPLALMEEPWLGNGRILMLEPRRLAARSVARYMAASLGEQVGQRVGYRVRLESRVGPETRVEVITEGILTRMLQADPALEGVGLIIFDEFHERSLQADLGLALSLQAQGLLREDLSLLVMSATLEAEPVAALLGGAPVLVSEGRSYPVTTQYLPRPQGERLEVHLVQVIRRALREATGDLLVFLPGAGEIRRVTGLLEEGGLPSGVRLYPLHGNLPQEEQDRAIQPSEDGYRKVVLTTAIAETSLTVAGVEVVIDSGLMRVPRFSPRTGMSRLETIPVSRASADQRRGRAGRLGPGRCYRLWSEQEDRQLLPRTAPEILEADLAPLALELATWGVQEPTELLWLDPPPAAALAQGRELLRQLGALTDEGGVTAHGREMARLGLHPRLAHLLLAGHALGLGGLAADLAALLAERDLVKGPAGADVDLRSRLELLRRSGSDPRVDGGALHRVRTEASHWRRLLGVRGSMEEGDVNSAGILLALAFPDRIAQRREDGRFLLRNGRGAHLTGVQGLSTAPYLVAAELDDQGAESRIFLAAPVTEEELRRHLGGDIQAEQLLRWEPEAKAVRGRLRERLGALLLRERPLPNPDPEQLLQALLEGIASEGLELLPWSRTVRQLRERIQFMAHWAPGWPDLSDEGLLANLPEWLGPHLWGMKGQEELQRLPLVEILLGLLTWQQRAELDEAAPTHLLLPSGSRVPVDYSDPAAPFVAARLQELFGWTASPRVGGGRVPLTLHLLSPAHRPVQVTQDLASFWRSAYFEVRKELRGRYPKHYWPEEPLTATPTNRTRPRP